MNTLGRRARGHDQGRDGFGSPGSPQRDQGSQRPAVQPDRRPTEVGQQEHIEAPPRATRACQPGWRRQLQRADAGRRSRGTPPGRLPRLELDALTLEREAGGERAEHLVGGDQARPLARQAPTRAWPIGRTEQRPARLCQLSERTRPATVPAPGGNAHGPHQASLFQGSEPAREPRRTGLAQDLAQHPARHKRQRREVSEHLLVGLCQTLERQGCPHLTPSAPRVHPSRSAPSRGQWCRRRSPPWCAPQAPTSRRPGPRPRP